MAKYASLKAAIDEIITTNGNYEISGEDVRNTLKSIVDSLGADYQFAGIATPETNPGTPDQNVAYLAGPGTYPNFGPTIVNAGCIGIFMYNGSWNIETIQILTDESVTTAKLANGAVTTTKLGDGSVTTAKLGDGNVTTAKLEDESVTTDKLANGAVTKNKLAPNSVGDIQLDEETYNRLNVPMTWTASGNAITSDVDSSEVVGAFTVGVNMVAFLDAKYQFRAVAIDEDEETAIFEGYIDGLKRYYILDGTTATIISLSISDLLSELLNNGYALLNDTYAHISSENPTYTGMVHGVDYDCCVVFLKEGRKSLQVINNTPLRYIYFSDFDFSVDNYISFDQQGNVPQEAKLCIVNFAKLDNPLGYDSLKILQPNSPIFTLDMDSKINDLLKTLNVITGIATSIDLSAQTQHAGWMASNGTFNNVTTGGGTHLTISRKNYQKITISASSINNSFIVFFNKLFIEPTYNGESFVKYLCKGETGRRTITVNTTVSLDIPDDCEYIVIGYDSTTGITDYRPIAVRFDDDGYFINKISEIDSKIAVIDQEGDFEQIDLSGPYYAGWIMSNGTFNNVTTLGGTHLTISAGSFKKFRIKGTIREGYNSFFFFAKSNYSEPTYNGESFVPYLCDEQTGRITVPYNTTVEYAIPSDCAYIIIGWRAQTGQSPYQPQNAAILTDKGINERLTNLEQITDSHIKLLSIGNSFSQDTLSYVPALLKSIAPNLKVTIGILYHGSCSLQMHWENRNVSDYYSFNLYDSETGHWINESNKSLNFGLTFTDWDIVTLQQDSSHSMRYDTYQPYLNDLIDLISQKCTNVTIGWLLTHAWAEGYSALVDNDITSDDMCERVQAASKRVMEETGVNLLLPYGTAIQNARHNDVLKLIGDGGNLCYSDKIHLQEGIGCQIAAYCHTLVILHYLSAKKGIYGNTLLIDADFETEYNIPNQHGSPVGSTLANCRLGQKAASVAIKMPYNITNIE